VKILRTIAGVLLAFGLLVFSIFNWKPVEVTLWENLVLETKVPVLVVLAFLAGFLPLWAYHLSVKFGLKRRVRSLENSLKTSVMARQHEPQVPVSRVDKPVDNPGSGPGETGLAPEAGGGSAGE